jgi:hypothetical protein
VGFAAGKKQQLVLVVTTAVRPGAILDSVKASRSSKEKPVAAVQRTAEVDATMAVGHRRDLDHHDVAS